tara:strand:- start:68258 stop:70408 length:2151 start_codon:yes stop_codon:yes gene_type:complete
MGVLFDSKKYSPLVYEESEIDLKEGTIAYDQYWDEQDHRCINGYKPVGMPAITGRHYFYMNMNKIMLLDGDDERKSLKNPLYRSLDRRLSYEVDNAIKDRYGLIIGKPRRVGLSWFGAMLIVYDMLFYLRNEVGVCAGKQDKADDFYAKVLALFSNIKKEYRSGILVKNSEEFKIGYDYTENKQKIEDGILSSMYIKTMFSDSSSFEGKSLSMCVFEEAGLFENIIASFKATEPCFKDGSKMFGLPLVYGTGGEIDKGSKGYKEMWENHKAFNLNKVFIPSYEYYPGDGIPDKHGNSISFFDKRTGDTDKEAALAYIMAERKRVGESRDALTKHIQSYPIKESEIFIKTKGGILDRRKLTGQMIQLNEGLGENKRKEGVLRWVDTEKAAKLLVRANNRKERCLIRLEHGSTVKFQETTNDPWLTKVADPINKRNSDYKPDIAGIDSYDDEVVQDGKHSFGAMMVYRCYAGVSTEYDYPIAYIKERGDGSTDDIFYEHSLMTAIYYNCETLIEYSKFAIMTWWKDVGAHEYLKIRPELEDVIGPSKARNEYGQRMNAREKALGTKLLKSEVNENVHKILFNEIIVDLMDYGDTNTDLAMAYVMCLIFRLEMFPEITEDLESDDEFFEEDDLLTMSYYDIENGHLVIKSYGDDRYDYRDDTEIELYNPKIDGPRRQKVTVKKPVPQKEESRNSLLNEISNKYGNDAMAFIYDDYIKKN